MAFQDYSTVPSQILHIGDSIYIGPNMARNDVREALQQLGADGRGLYDLMMSLTAPGGAQVYTSQADGETATAEGDVFAYASGGRVYYATRTASGSTVLAEAATQAALEPLAEAAESAAASAAADAVTTAADAEATAADRVAVAADRVAVAADRNEVTSAALASSYIPGARSFVPQGMTDVAITAAGTGGTDGAYILPLTGDNLSVDAFANVTVSGGAVTAVSVNAPGLYLGASPTPGTVDTSTITGLTGATLTPTIGYLKTSGQYYLTDHATDPNQVSLFQNQSNVAVETVASIDWLNRAATEAARDDALATLAVLSETQILNTSTSPTAGDGAANAGTFVLKTPLEGKVTTLSIDIHAHTTGTIAFKRATKSGTTYTQQGSDVSVTISSTGAQTLTANVDLLPGEYLLFYQSAAIIGFLTGSPSDAGIGFIGSGNLTSGSISVDQTTALYQIAIEATVLTVSGEQIDELEASVDGTASQAVGTDGDPIAVAGGASAGTFIFPVPIANGGVPTVKVYAFSTGAILFKRFSRSGGTYTQQGSDVSATVSATGLQTLAPDIELQPGEYLGFYQASAVLGFSNNDYDGEGLSYAGAGNLTTVSLLATPPIGVRFEIQATIAWTPVRADAISRLSDRVGDLENETSNERLFAYGNSLTQGQGQTPYTTPLQTALARTVYNRGVGAQRAPDILCRMGAMPLLCPAVTVPASGAVDFAVPVGFYQAQPLTHTNPADTFTGWLGEIYGTLSYVSGTVSGSHTYRFTRASAGTATDYPQGVPFQVEITDNRDSSINIFWLLRNSIGLQEWSGATYDEQLSAALNWMEIAERYLTARNKQFIVLGEINRNDEYPGSVATASGSALTGDTAHALIVELNRELADRYGEKFIDVREWALISGDGGATDNSDVANDVVPTSLRIDHIHLTAAAYETIVADPIEARVVRLGW